MRRQFLFPLGAMVAAAVVAAASIALWETADEGTSSPAATAVPVDGEAAAGVDLPLTEIYRRALPGVVEITVGGDGPFGGPTAGGSGFVLDEDGHVVTNQHVVGGASSATVTFADGTDARAEVVGIDPSTDVALLRLENSDEVDLTPLPLGSSASLEVGETVVAIGSPFGLEGTLTAGVVSAVDRQIRAPDGFSIDEVIQTDAAINSGNSGGPLLDGQGRVIGINTQIQSETGGNVGIGYAVPIDTVKDIVAELRSDGQVQHAWLGVSIQEGDAGAVVSDVIAGSPADDAGLRPGDVVVDVDGVAINQPEDLTAIVSDAKPGDTVRLEVQRDGALETIEIELGERPDRLN